MIEIEKLWEQIDASVRRLEGRECPLEEAAGCVTAEPVRALVAQPGFDQSAMDGFAFAETAPGRCNVAGTVAAGDLTSGLRVTAGIAARIMTGALLPEGTRAVARQEDCETDGQSVSLKPGVALREGVNIRSRGGVFQPGEQILAEGVKVTPGAVALLISAGRESLRVIPRTRVLHLVTGSELVQAGGELRPGQVHDSNGPMISGLLHNCGTTGGSRRLGDDRDALLRAVSTFDGDLLLVSGGSGPGERDFTTHALEAAGFVIHVSRINSRPGGPLVFATRGRTVAFGLPGNPLSHWVCFHAFVRRALNRLHGLPAQELTPAALTGDFHGGGDGRRTWMAAIVQMSNGHITAEPLPWKHSGDLMPLAFANGLVLDRLPGGRCNLLIL